MKVALCARLSDRRLSSASARRRTCLERADARPDAKPILAPWQVSLATGIMQRDFSRAVSVPDLACQCRLSLSYFIRAFSNTVGIAPYAWFVQKRVQHAEALLTGTQLPIAQIALECGFTDQPHFTKAFAKAKGTTPARWRRGFLLD
ncbi:helix-turn-helix domain-containing protein [Sphingobium yanoikuyae]|nr:AraC family transcriptional regulator [Sphingobium yanoikuyae]